MLTHGQLVPQLGGTASMSAGKGKLPIATQPELGETELDLVWRILHDAAF